MNRNEVYYILKQFFKTYRTKVNGKTYKKLFVPADNSAGVYINEKIYISGINHCYICNDELVLRDRYAMMQVNIKYKDIESLRVFEHYEE